MIEHITRTITRETYDNGSSCTTSRTDARYTLVKINWVRTRNVSGATTHTGSRAGWFFAIHAPVNGRVEMTGHHEDGRNVKGSYLTVSGAKEAALFSMRPDEAMAWTTDRRNSAAVFKIARWGGFSFTYYGTVLRVLDNVNNETVDHLDMSSFDDARQRAKDILFTAYGSSTTPVRSEGPDVVSEALTRALTAAGVRVTDEQLSMASSTLATELRNASF